MKKKMFFDVEISWFLSIAINFLKAVERNWKKNQGQVGIISEKLKKFGVHRCIPQSTADNQYQVGLSNSDLKNSSFINAY